MSCAPPFFLGQLTRPFHPSFGLGPSEAGSLFFSEKVSPSSSRCPLSFFHQLSLFRFTSSVLRFAVSATFFLKPPSRPSGFSFSPVHFLFDSLFFPFSWTLSFQPFSLRFLCPHLSARSPGSFFSHRLSFSVFCCLL